MYMNDGNKTKINLRNKSVFITGVAGFIGSSLAKRLLSTVEGVKVVGLDNMNHYYDVRLKEARLNELEQFDNFSFVKGNLADKAVIESIFEQYKPEIVVNLGAQAGVRYSITNPDAYVEANLIGFYNILEACRHSYDEGHTPVEHLVYASSSSVYGSNKKVPYSTDDKVDNPVSLYAATKKSNELMAHAYSKLYNIPSTGLRFFTVYGPAGRPDMAYFGFTNKLLKGETIQIFNYGNCKRDFTYVDDIVEGVVRVMQGAPERKNGEDGLPVPPYAVYNIGNQNPENLLDFVQILQEELIRAGVLPEDYDFEAHKKLVPMQPGDVPVTYADTSALERDFGYTDYIQAQPGWVFVGIYADEGISGTSLEHRKGMQQLIEDCKAGKIDLVLTKSIARFARNIVDCLSVIELLKNLNLRDPAIVIRKDSITFNTACITGLEDVVYVHVMFNNDLKRIVVRGCDENDKDALRWCVAKPDKRKSRKMSCKPFATLVYQKMGWDSECRYKMLGYRITFEGETLYVFDLLVPEIFHEGQRKKNAVDSQDNAASTKPVNSRKGFYLDDIVGTFGVPVEEHRKESEVKQMDGYVSMGILTGKIAPEAGKD